jgi:hypothetical protein
MDYLSAEAENSNCEYCGDSLCGGDCQMHPGSIITIAGLGGLVLLALTIWVATKIR